MKRLFINLMSLLIIVPVPIKAQIKMAQFPEKEKKENQTK